MARSAKLILALLALPMTLPAQKIKPLPVIMTTAIVADCASTIWFRHNKPWQTEMNPLLGKYPSDLKIVTFCLAGIATANLFASRLHGALKPTFYLTLTAISLNQSIHNRFDIGLYLPF